ncbi:hypothetical protein [Chitinimonas naiadis]
MAEAPVPALPAETSIKGLCSNTNEVGKALAAEFVRAVNKRKEPFKGAKMRLELVVSAAGFVNQVKVLDAADEELGQVALLAAGMLQCKATGRTVRAIYPIVFSVAE